MMFQDFDQRTKKLLLLFLSLLLCWWLCFAPVTCSASDTPDQTQAVYQITEQELMQFENNLVQLKAINTRLQTDLKVQSDEATALKKEVIELKKLLEQLRSLSMTQESSLMTANRLLDEYATEAKRKRLRIKAQRNGWEAVAAMALIAFAVK